MVVEFKQSNTSQSSLSELVHRMLSDVRLGIVTLYGLCVTVLITPFGIFRLSVGDIAIGLVDLGIVGVFLSLIFLAWKSGKVQLAADLTAVAATGAVIAVVLILGLSYIWTFSTLVGSFLMARLRVAVMTSFVLVISLGLHPAVFDTATDRATYLTVSALVSLLSLIFAARLNHRHVLLRDMLSTDSLTGAFNRRGLDYDLPVFCQNDQADHCLVMMDIDNFKCLNDLSGHDAGDQVLISLAQIVGRQTRQGDRFYRYGGEEFVLLLSDTPKAGAEITTSKLQNTLRQQLRGPGGVVTISMGVAQRRPGESPGDWLKRADEALLAAKRSGKDRIVFAD